MKRTPIKYITIERPIYCIYEIAPDCKEHGRFIKSFLDQERAIAFMEKSIFRFMKTSIQIESKRA